MIKENKKYIIILALVLIVALFIFYINRPAPPEIKETLNVEPTLEQLIDSITAPNIGEQVSDETLESLSAPSHDEAPSDNPVSDDVIDSLTAPK